MDYIINQQDSMSDTHSDVSDVTHNFEKIASKYYDCIHFVVKNVLGPKATRQDVEDCINESLLAIWKSLDDYNSSRCSLKTWICIICRRKSIDYIRKSSHINEQSIDDHIFVDDCSFEKQLELKVTINDLVSCLNDREREIFYKKFFFGMSENQISKQMHISTSNVSSLIYRARKKLLAIREENDL